MHTLEVVYLRLRGGLCMRALRGLFTTLAVVYTRFI